MREQRQVGILLQRDSEQTRAAARSICTASAPSPTSCATSRRRTARIISSCQGEQRFRVVEFLERLAVPRGARRSASPSPRTRTPEIEARFLNLQAPGGRGARAAAAGAAGADRRRAERATRRARSPTSPPPTSTSKPAEKQEILETFDVSARIDKVSRAARPAHRGAAPVAGDRPADQGGARRAPARGAAARADGRHPAAARRGRGEQGAGDRRARRGDRQGRHAEGGRGAGAQGAAAPGAHARGGGRIRHDAHLSRLADRAAVEAARGAADRHRRGAPHPRRGPLRPRQDQAAHRRVPRGAQARAAGQGADPVLRRPARRRQDLARPIDRARHGPQVRARQPRRRARRGRDPRPPAHLHRRAAGQHHPGHPQGRGAQLRDDARRDRQARQRHPGRSVARRCSRCSTRSRTHTFRDNYLARAVRPEPRRVHHHGQRARHDPRAAARPHGDHPAPRLHRRGEARDRTPLSRRAASSRPTACEPSRSRSTTTRCARSSATTRAKPACATSSARSARCFGTPRCASPRARPSPIRIDESGPRRHPRRAACSRAKSPCARACRAWPPASPGRRSAATSCSSRRRALPGSGQPDPHRPARRGDEGERAGGAQLVKNRAASLGIDAELFEKSDIHVHVPAGAIPKDGPSAGVAMFMALVVAADRPARCAATRR